MDFARKILANYGWKEGDGLGKNKDGIAKPLKATLKFDNAGFGADQAAADFNNHWWKRVFNEAATNVDIKKDGEEIKMALKDDEDGVEISTKGYSMKKLKKLKNKRGETENGERKNGYGNFLQSATLTSLGDEVENPDKIDTNDIEVSKVKVLTDEELFKACGGRTAHKGARHGLKLSGKLSRIEQQEAELLAKMMAKRNGLNEDSTNRNKLEKKSTEPINNLDQATGRKKKEKKNKTLNEETQEVLGDTDLAESFKLSKKKRKHKETESTEENVVEKEEMPNEECKKKKRNKGSEVKTVTIDSGESFCKESSQSEPNDELRSLKKKKKKHRENISEEEIAHKKKKSKNKNKDIE